MSDDERDRIALRVAPAMIAQAFAEEAADDGTMPVFEKAAAWSYAFADMLIKAGKGEFDD